VIGITTARILSAKSLPLISLDEAYVGAVLRAGGIPLLVPLGLADADLNAILARLDGLLLSGGGDVHPAVYHSHEHPKVNEVDEDRDRVEIAIFRGAIERRMPVFGICRGQQLINVAMGGSLYEDILDQHPNAIEHTCFPAKPRDFPAHPVEVDPSSRLADILGTGRIKVNSLHHQAIRKLAPGLVPTAEAPDGILEAVEMEGYPFGLAVQWHPEWMQDHLAMRALVRAFIDACSPESDRV
jgi:putative glutamine amidotransferase